MRYLVLSDLHEHFRNLLKFIDLANQNGGYDRLLFLGDAVGHGNNNHQYEVDKCLAHLKAERAICVFGNWEWWLLNPGSDNDGHQSRYSEELQALRGRLANEAYTFIKQWNWMEEIDDFTLTHGCPYQRHNSSGYIAKPWETYLYPHDTEVVGRIFSQPIIKTSHLLVGHTHHPGFFHYNGRWARWCPINQDHTSQWTQMDGFGGQYLLNPGSASDNRQSAPWPTALLVDTGQRSFLFLRA